MSKEQEKPIEVLFYPACIPKTPVRKTLVPDPDFGMLKTMQNTVDGYIEIIPHPIYPDLRIVCNEEGKLEGLPLNRALKTEDGEIYDIIAGNFFICGLGEENFCSLSPELAEKFKEEFKHPEKFVRIAGKILAVKQPVPGDGAPEKPQKGPEL